jgi:hypothetical protein
MEEHLTAFVKKWWKNKPWFPDDYCNPAASALQKLLKGKGIETTKVFSYTEPGVGHTFLMDEEGNIIDPTYGQFDSQYKHGFYGKEFPDSKLQKNILEGKAYMELQKQRLQDGLYQ